MPKFKNKIVEKNIKTAEIWALFQTKLQFSECNITETDFCVTHIQSLIIIDSFKNKANPIFDTMRVMGGLN